MSPTQQPLQLQANKAGGPFKRHYEFILNDVLKASLHYERAFSDRATIQINEHTWTIRRVGFWKRQIELTANQSPYTKASMPSGWKFRLSYRASDGHVYSFKPTGFWKRTWAWYNEQEQVAINMKTGVSFSKRRGDITLHEPATEEMYLLMVLGWYQLIAYQAQAAAAAT